VRHQRAAGAVGGKNTQHKAALNPHIGYERAAEIANKALAEGITLRQAAIASGHVTGKQFDAWVDPRKMIMPFKPTRR
jgi:fumarate hydratase class II